MILPFDTIIFPHQRGVYIVGGSIRDLLCDRSPFDYDVAVQCDPASFAKQLDDPISAKLFGEISDLGRCCANRRCIRRR